MSENPEYRTDIPVQPELIIRQTLSGWVAASTEWRQHRVDLTYSPDDPHAIRLTHHSGNALVPWIFDLSLLERGLSDEAGEGDVVIQPSDQDGGGKFLQVRYASNAGEFIFLLSVEEIILALREINQQFPPNVRDEIVSSTIQQLTPEFFYSS